MTLPRLSAAAALIGLLSACGGDGDTSVRNGPQAVHPSPSALASGTSGLSAAPQISSIQHIVIINTTSPCAQTKSCGRGRTGYTSNDGSQPIID